MAGKKEDIALEIIVFGSMYKEPDLYIEYGTNIKSKYDFTDTSAKFFYDCFELFYKTYSTEIDEVKINTFMLQDDDRKSLYKQLGGWNTIKKAMELADVEDFANYYDQFKKYSLMREYERKGFPTQILLQHPKYEKLRADQVTQWMRATVDKVHTNVGGGNDSVKLGSNMVSKVKKWRETPAMGIEFPWENWTALFRGWRKKKLVVDGMLSNEGKSRRLTFLLAYFSLIKGEKCLMMANEMDEEDISAGMIAAVCNNPVFGFEYNIPEGNIVLGEYDSEEQFEQAMEVAEYIENNTKIFFKEMNDYSDESIEHEVKKHVIGLGVQEIFYDTLKGYKTDNWEVVKQTATKLKDLAQEMNVRAYATIQLTDDSLFVDIMDFSSNNIANAKQLKHVVDHMMLEKKIDRSEYENYLLLDEWGNKVTLKEYDDRNSDKIKWYYYGQKVDKNRGGGKGMVLCTKVNLDLNVWIEVGLLTVNADFKNKNSSKSKKTIKKGA